MESTAVNVFHARDASVGKNAKYLLCRDTENILKILSSLSCLNASIGEVKTIVLKICLQFKRTTVSSFASVQWLTGWLMMQVECLCPGCLWDYRITCAILASAQFLDCGIPPSLYFTSRVPLATGGRMEGW